MITASEELFSDAKMRIRWLGRMEYQTALKLQEELAKSVTGGAAEEILLLEHDPVYTIGRTPDRTSLRNTENLPHPLVEVSRGGQATFHGPGQLVGYPLLDLRRHVQDLHLYLRRLEQILIDFTHSLGIPAEQRQGFTGVWVGERKLASIGVGVRQWVTRHGFALNVCGQLDGFSAITPCGITEVEMTSLEREGAQLENVRQAAAGLVPFLKARLSDW